MRNWMFLFGGEQDRVLRDTTYDIQKDVQKVDLYEALDDRSISCVWKRGRRNEPKGSEHRSLENKR